MRHSIILIAFALIAGCTSPQLQHCPFDMQEVFAHCGLTNAIPVQPVRWSQLVDERPLVVDRIVAIGASGTNFVVLSAYRHPQSSPRWNIDEISLMLDDGELWIVGKREFAEYPSQQDVHKLLQELDEFNDDPKWKIEFEGSVPIRKPTKF